MRRRVRTKASDDDDEEELIPPTAAEEGAEAMPADGRLAEFLQAASTILAELRPLSSTSKEGAVVSPGWSDLPAISQRAGTSTAHPALAATILSLAWSAEPAKLEAEPSSPTDMPLLRRRLPIIKEFVAASGDWVAFKWRFLTNANFAGWIEAMRGLPATLDDDALTTYLSIPPSERSNPHASILPDGGCF
ncbi:unnamed protein product [Lampetra planeri]